MATDHKQFRAIPDAWRETRRLKPEETALAENVRTAPIIFQRFVEAAADVRVTVIGDEIFAGSTDPRQGEYPVDFRYNSTLRWELHTLPTEIEGLVAPADAPPWIGIRRYRSAPHSGGRLCFPRDQSSRAVPLDREGSRAPDFSRTCRTPGRRKTDQANNGSSRGRGRRLSGMNGHRYQKAGS